MNSETVPAVAAQRKTVCIDFDGVITPFVSDLYAQIDPLPGAKDVIQTLRDRGFRIVIMTSRLSPEWHDAETDTVGEAVAFGIKQWNFVQDYLNRNGIPYDKITSEKVPAIFYLDDRAINFDGDWTTAYHKIQRVLDDAYPH